VQSQVSRDERHAMIENLLFHSPDGLRAVELAKKCGVDRRTIYRDIAKLQANGVPLYQKQGRFFVSREYYHAPVQLTLNETAALFAAVRVWSQISDVHNPHIISALSKLSEGLPEPMAQHVGAVGAMMRHQPVDRLLVRVIETVIHAWGEQQWVHIWTAKDEAVQEVAPKFLEATPDGALYMVGFEAKTRHMRTFRLDQILRIEPLQRTAKSTGFASAEQYMTDFTGLLVEDTPAKVDVVLVFAAEIANQIASKKFSALRKAERLEDGRLVVHLRVKDWQDLMGFVRRFGSDIEVIKPDAMRQVIADEAQQLAALYMGNRAQ